MECCPHGCSVFSPSLSLFPQSLTDLDLSGNIDKGGGVQTLADAIKDGKLPELRRLDLQSTMAGLDGIKALCKGLCPRGDPKCPNLAYLNIQGGS